MSDFDSVILSCTRLRTFSLPVVQRSTRSGIVLIGVFFLTLTFASLTPVFPSENRVEHIIARGPINASMRHFLRSRLETADDRHPDHIILELQSRYGRIDYVLDVVDVLERTTAPVTIYLSGPVEGPAAMLGFCGEHLFMHPDARIHLGPAGSGSASSSLFREGYAPKLALRFARIAKRNGFPEAVAYAMVNPALNLNWVPERSEKFLTGDQMDRLKKNADISVRETINSSGERFALSPGDARRFGLSEKTVTHPDEILRSLRSDTTLQMSLHIMTWPFTHTLYRLSTGYIPVGLFIILGTVTALLEIRRPGTGWTGAIAALSFGIPVLTFAHLGLCPSPAMLLLLIGLCMLAIDTLLMPGISLLGFLGFVPAISSLILARNSFVFPDVSQSPWEVQYLFDSFSTCLIFLGAGIAAYSVLMHFSSDWFLSITLLHAPEDNSDYPNTGTSPEELIGTHGTVRKGVRPIGTIEVEGKLIHVMTGQFYLEPGTEIEITGADGPRLTARIR